MSLSHYVIIDSAIAANCFYYQGECALLEAVKTNPLWAKGCRIFKLGKSREAMESIYLREHEGNFSLVSQHYQSTLISNQTLTRELQRSIQENKIKVMDGRAMIDTGYYVWSDGSYHTVAEK